MDLYTIPCKKNCKSIKSRTQPQFDLQIMGKATPFNRKHQDFLSTTSRERNNTFFCKKMNDRSVGCDLFENVLINKTFQFQSNNTSFEFQQPRVFTPDIKVLRKKKNGKVVFQPIARMVSPSRIYDNPTMKKPKVRRVINLNFFQNQDQDPFFYERKANLFEFVYKTYQ